MRPPIEPCLGPAATPWIASGNLLFWNIGVPSPTNLTIAGARCGSAERPRRQLHAGQRRANGGLRRRARRHLTVKWALFASRQLYFLTQVLLSRDQNRWNISLFISKVWLPENIIMAGMRILFPDMKEFS